MKCNPHFTCRIYLFIADLNDKVCRVHCSRCYNINHSSLFLLGDTSPSVTKSGLWKTGAKMQIYMFMDDFIESRLIVYRRRMWREVSQESILVLYCICGNYFSTIHCSLLKRCLAIFCCSCSTCKLLEHFLCSLALILLQCIKVELSVISFLFDNCIFKMRCCSLDVDKAVKQAGFYSGSLYYKQLIMFKICASVQCTESFFRFMSMGTYISKCAFFVEIHMIKLFLSQA